MPRDPMVKGYVRKGGIFFANTPRHQKKHKQYIPPVIREKNTAKKSTIQSELTIGSISQEQYLEACRLSAERSGFKK